MKTPFAEIDLLFSDSKRVIAIEVKAKSSDEFSLYRVSPRQKTKLKNARNYLEDEYGQAQLVLALVSHDASIEVIENFLG